MNEVEYVLRIVLKARDDLAKGLASARRELRGFVKDINDNQSKINAFNTSLQAMTTNVENVTNKFKDWRAVMEGTSRGNADAKKSFGDLGREVNETAKTQKRAADAAERHALAQDKLLKSADKLRNEYRKLDTEEARNDKNRGFTLSRLQQIGRELDSISKRVDDPAIRRFYYNWSMDAKFAANEIQQSNKQIIESNKQVVKDEEAAATKRQAIRDRDAAARAAFARTFAVREKITGGGDRDFIDIAEAKQTVTVLKQVAKGYDDNSKTARRLRGEAERLNAELRNTGREGNHASGVFRTLVSELRNNSDSIATLDNQFRGLGLLTVIGFAQQLITVLTGLAGSLFSVASSAAEAAASLGGMATAGLAQAIPVVGLLGAAFAQAKGAMDAMKQAQLERQQASVQGASADRRTADAADAIANAQKRLKDAQTNLTEAREDGRKELEDLIQAENDAKLAAIGAALSQKEAQQALVKAQATGDTQGIQRAQLALLQAQSDATDSLTQKKRAAAEADKGREGGVEGLPSVQRAVDQVKAAQRGIQTAKRNADEAAKGTDTAAAKLQFLLSQMTAGQRALFHALEALRKVYIENFGPISDIILGSFTRVVKRITTLLQSAEILSAARKLSTEISKQLNRITDAFLGDKMIDQFLRIAEQARTNLKPVTDIIIDLGKAFFNIAEAAGPSFSKFLGFIGDLVGKFADLTGNKDKMTDFFDTGEEHLEAWIKLGLSVINLFLALAGAGGAEQGVGMVEDLTKAIQGLTDWVDTHREDVVKFFEDSRHVAEEVVGVVVAIAEEIYKAFTPERIDNFANLIKDVILPALGDVVDFLGDATAKLVEFAETPFGGELLKGMVAFFVLSKVLSGVLGSFKAFGTFLGPIAKAFFSIGKDEAVFTKIVQGFMDLSKSGALTRFAGIAGRFLGIVGAVIALLQWLGLLDDAWRAVRDGFMAFWKEVAPSLRKLFKSFKELWEVVSEGKGLFGILRAVLRPLVKVFIEIGGIILKVFGRTLGRIIGGAIDILTGIITFLTGVFTGDWRKAWSGIRQIFRGFFRAVGAIFRAIPELIGDIAKKILPAFKKGINALWNWLEKLPHRLGDLASKGAKAFTDAFLDVGSDILKGIISGLKTGANFVDMLVNKFIDLINHALPDKIDIPGPLGSINLPNNPIPHLAVGGPVPGSGRGDTVAALLEPGEHVLTRQEVAAMGGHGAVFALRRALGGGGQGYGGRFRDGGAAVAGGLTVTFQGGTLDDFGSAWREFWNSLVVAARQGSNRVESQFRDMRVNTTRSADRMYRNVRSSIADIEKSFDVRGKRIVDSWSDMWMSLKKVTAEGLNYIGHETNKALVALGEKHLDFHLTAPKKADAGKAGGGWIGRQGQRGADRGFYPLGAGEAVLNWQHQKYVEPAMNAYYGHGLNTMFDRVHGYHAGDGPGYARGRPAFSPIPGMPGEEAATRAVPTIVKLIKQYHAIITDAYDRDRSAGHKSPGHNVTGTAIDAVPGPGGSWNTIEAMGKWAVGKGMTVGYGAGVPGSQAWAGHGRGNHIHIELGGNPAAVVDFVTKIGRPLVKGGGELAKLSQAAIDMVLKAANATLSETIPEVSGTTTFPLGPGGPAQKVFDFFTGRGLSDAIAAGFVGTFQKESGFVTTVTNAAGSGATGLAQWLGGRLTALKSKPNWTSLQTQLNFVWEELHGAESGAFAAIKGARTPEEAAQIIDSQYERSDNILNAPSNARQAYNKFHGTGKPRKFAAGGIVPGPEGSPVPILAHAQEWILNSGQVNRIANMLGTSRAALRSMMGFYGGPGGAQGGTEVDTATISPLTTPDVKKIDSAKLRKMVVQLRKIGRVFDDAAVDIGSVEEWSGFLRRMSRRLGRVTRRLKAGEKESEKSGTDFDRGIRAFMDGVDKMLEDTTGTFFKLRASIERRISVRARRLVRRQFDVSRRGIVSRTDERSEEEVQQRLARRELLEQRRQRPELVGERQAIARTLRRVRRQQRRGGLSDEQKQRLQGEENQLRAALDDAKQRVTDNIAAIYDAQQAYLDAQLTTQQSFVDAISKRYETANAGLELFRRVATAIGNEDAIRTINAKQRELLSGQATELDSRINGLRAIGTKAANEAADQIAAQVADLRVQIFESIQQELKDAVDRINTRAQRRLGRLDLAGRMLDAVGAVGLGTAASVGGERFTRAGIFAQRGQALAAQRTGLQGVLREAQGAGNLQLIQDLTDQLAELDVTIQENTKAAFDAKTEAINQRFSYLSTNNDLKSQIVSLTGQISGNTDQAALLRLAQEKTTLLQTQRAGLMQQLADATAAKNQSAVEDLTTQLLQNELATLQNTQATNELTGNLSKDQGFTSTAWEVFSQAIFTGSGGLLPMYQSLFPSAAVGADVLGSGMLMAHAGERVIPAKVAALSGGGNMGDTNYFDIDINEAGRPIDWAGAATQIMFKKSGAK